MAITTAARERRGITERQWQVCLVAAVAVAVEEGVASVSVTCWTLVDIEIIRAHVSVTPRLKEGDETPRSLGNKSGRPTS